MTHILTITKIVDECPEEYEVKCSGQGCGCYMSCYLCPHTPSEEEKAESEFEAHGAHHLLVDGYWMTSLKNLCALTGTDSGVEGIHEIAREYGLGKHHVDIDYEGDSRWNVIHIRTEES